MLKNAANEEEKESILENFFDAIESKRMTV